MSAKWTSTQIETIIKEYNSFDSKLNNVMECDETDEVDKKFETFLFETHRSSKDYQKECTDKSIVISFDIDLIII